MRVVDLYCGVGGLSKGLQDAGFEIVASYDNWPVAVETFSRNMSHPAECLDLLNNDVAVERISKLKPDLIAGGPPCQDFSTAGHRKEGENANLTVAYASIVAACKPRFAIMENVPQVRKSAAYGEAKQILEQEDYNFSECILDASRCGVPQIRKRFFMFAWLGEEIIGERFQTWIEDSLSDERLTVKEYMKDEITDEYYYRHPRNYSRRAIFAVHEPSPTIRGVNRPVPPNYKRNSLDSASPDEVRALTSLERSRIQTFPSSWKWEDEKSNGLSKSDIELLIGNAVPVNLAAFVGNGVQHAIDSMPSLYGFTKTNTNRAGEDLWGKNQFNSTFPLSLCLKMRKDKVRPVSVCLAEQKIPAYGNKLHINKVDANETWDMEDIVGKRANAASYAYRFEEVFEPFKGFLRTNSLEKIDLVVLKNDKPWLPFEVKLTVVPDSSTVGFDESEWGPELVIRPVTSAYAMMSVAKNLLCEANKKHKDTVCKALETVYNALDKDQWNRNVIKTNNIALAQAFSNALNVIREIQRPFLIQPIWRTKGQSFVLSDQCFDVFIWSDATVMSIPLERFSERKTNAVSRHLREIARHVRALYDILTVGNFNYMGIYGGMPLGNQTDKSFSISGKVTRKYIAHERLKQPNYSPDVLSKIILGGGQNSLKPERRFDAAVVSHFAIKSQSK